MRQTFIVGLILLVLFILVGMVKPALASAPRGATQYAGLVLKKIDPIEPSSYTDDFFIDRDSLARDVADVIRIMADPLNNDPVTWCMGIDTILTFATLTNTYFDIGVTNPALDDFKKNCLKVKQLAGCP